MAAQVRVAPGSSRVADGVHRLGDHYVNWYVLEDGGRLTVIDAGLPGHWGQLPSLLTTIGRTVADIVVVLLTHGHPIISVAPSRSVGPRRRLSSSTAMTPTVHVVGASTHR